MKRSPIRLKKHKEKKSKLSKKAGMPPGTVVHVGRESNSDVSMSLVHYTAESVVNKEKIAIEECSEYLQKEGILWITVNGIHKTQVIESVGKLFNLHSLVLEDIVNTEQRPKYEEFDDYLFFTLKNLEFDVKQKETHYEQISFVLGKNYVISFQEKESDLFLQIKERIINGISRARGNGADYLVYLLIDATVDSYYSIIENIEDNIETLEERVLVDTSGSTLAEIQKIKRDLVVLLKSVFPLREAIGKIQRRENPLIHESTHIFFNSIYDHVVHIIESVESQRDILSGLMDIYLSNISNRMNSVMKVLTVIATIFIPLTFFAGVYGMNFKHFPELEWRWGYALFWGLCLFCVLLMLFYFRKKKWL